MLDAWLGGGVLISAVVLFAGFMVLAWWPRRPTYERVEKQGLQAPLGKRLFEASVWTCTPVARGLVALGLGPDAVSWASVVAATAAGVAFAFGHWGVGALCFYLSGIMDVLDGMVARIAGRVSAAGGVLDSSLDRYSDFAVLAGIAVHYRARPWILLAVLLSLQGSFMVSYSSAKAEALQVTPPRGRMKRTERGPLLVVGAALSALSIPLIEAPRGHDLGVPMVVVVAVIAVFANVSAARRLATIARAVRDRPPT